MFITRRHIHHSSYNKKFGGLLKNPSGVFFFIKNASIAISWIGVISFIDLIRLKLNLKNLSNFFPVDSSFTFKIELHWKIVFHTNGYILCTASVKQMESHSLISFCRLQNVVEDFLLIDWKFEIFTEDDGSILYTTLTELNIYWNWPECVHHVSFSFRFF